jgi:hypothetical protein
VSENINVQFVGFETKVLVREYTFKVREPAGASREFTLTIANEAFVSHRARYQDGPGICSLRLHRELAAHENYPSTTAFCVTEEELADFHSARTKKPFPGRRTHKNEYD